MHVILDDPKPGFLYRISKISVVYIVECPVGFPAVIDRTAQLHSSDTPRMGYG